MVIVIFLKFTQKKSQLLLGFKIYFNYICFMDKEQIYKMGKRWVIRFVDEKKKNDGWKVIDNADNTQIVLKPNGEPFALFEKDAGLVHTTANVMQVQW